MRRFASRVGVSGSLALVVATSYLLVGGRTSTGFAEPQAASGSYRLLYASDWSGSSEIYAADPARRALAQVTFGRAPTCGQGGCGYTNAVPSPNGRFLLYADFSSCGTPRRVSLYVARGDGSHRRVLARSRSRFDCPGPLGGVWAPDSRRIAYAVDGRTHIFDVTGRRDHVVGRGARVEWSPDGKTLALLAVNSSRGSGPLYVRRNGRTRLIAPVASEFAWSPNGRWIAYSFLRVPGTPGATDELDIVHPDGSGRRTFLTGYLSDPQWSADSAFLSVVSGSGVTVVKLAGGAVHPLAFSSALAWKPSGHVLAVADQHGTYVVDAGTAVSRKLTGDEAAAGLWSPDGRLLAYTTHVTLGYLAQSQLRVVTLAGETRTLVGVADRYGGDPGMLAWARVPKGAHYRTPQNRVIAELAADRLTARWPITRLAADGDRVAYISCGHVFVWTPSAHTVAQAEPNSSLSPRCSSPGDYLAFWLYTLALSGDRIAYGYLEGNMGQTWGLYGGRIGDESSFVSLGSVASANGCGEGTGGLGGLAGAGSLLVFSTWRDDRNCPARTLEQEIHRVDPGNCPCPVIATSPGPLVPFDVDAGRIVAGGENATVVYDASGTQLISVPVSPLAAQLAGSDLLILVRGELLIYDATTGARLHAWPLPDVPSGGECGSPHGGTWECRQARLVLEDASRGLATYVLDGQVHVLRLADGADRTVGAGAFARFMDAGLVYADGANLHFVPFAQLPLP